MQGTVIVVLAAGGSSRLGRPKQLLPYQGSTLIRHAVGTAVDTGFPVVVVLGAEEQAIRREIADLPAMLVKNDAWQEGQASSIRAGVLAAREADALLFMLCDQPFLSSALLAEIIATHATSGKSIVAASYGKGVRGVPALFGRSLFGELLDLRGHTGAKNLIAAHAAEVATVPFPHGDIDVDTREDFDRLTAGKIP